MPSVSFLPGFGGPPPPTGRAGHQRRRLSVVSVFAMLLIAAAAACSVWWYEVALRHSETALSSQADALQAQRASTLFWRERETMNEYLLHPEAGLLGEIAEERRGFAAATADLGAGGESAQELVVLSRRANAGFLETVVQIRGAAGSGDGVELSAVQRLNAAEASVLEPLEAL